MEYIKQKIRVKLSLILVLVLFNMQDVFSNNVGFISQNTFLNTNKNIFFNKKCETKNIMIRLNAINKIFKNKSFDSDISKLPYTFSHQFYIPLLYAYDTNDIALIECYEDLFTLEVIDKVIETNEIGSLDKKVFYFIVSEFLRKSGIVKKTDKELIFFKIREQIFKYWNEVPSKVWSNELFGYVGVKNRLDFILNDYVKSNYNYHKAITDNELFVLATGISLGLIEREYYKEIDPTILDMNNSFLKILNKLVFFSSKELWYLQPNVWKDHPDFKGVILEKGEFVTWDAAHFSRFPAYLLLLIEFNQSSTNEYNYLIKLKSGLRQVFVEKVIENYNEEGKKLYFNNYMDGNNSVYRLGYKSRKGGFKANENNVHVFYGWWKLLEGKSIDNVYRNLSSNFDLYASDNPLVESHKEIYKEIIQLN